MRDLLDPAEAEVYDLLIEGYSNKLIAWERQVGIGTIKNQVTAILRKTRKQSRCQLIVAHYRETKK